eukprot:77872_1
MYQITKNYQRMNVIFVVILKKTDHDWLQKMNLKDKNIWKRFCNCRKLPFSDLKLNPSEFWEFDASSDYNEYIPSFNAQIHSDILSDWKQYYELKQISFKSPAT